MNHHILKRFGLEHLDVASPDFLTALNRLQQEARDGLQTTEVPADPGTPAEDPDAPLAGFEWIEPANEDLL
ncbi:MAG: hypothetical protein ACREPX_12035 [Rhodanobacteraceae bacterium]